MATHSNILAWRIPWTEEPGRLQSMESQRVGHARARAHTHTHTHTIIIYTLQDSSVAHSSGWSDGRRRYRFFPADKLKLIDGERTGWSLGTVILDGIGLSVGPLGGTGFQRAFRKNTGMRFS